MGKLSDEHDIPTSERGRDRIYKKGFKGFDWWISNPFERFTLGFSWYFGEAYGPMGAKNGSYQFWNLGFSFLCFAARLDWCRGFVSDDPKHPDPVLVSEYERDSRAHTRRETPEEVVERMQRKYGLTLDKSYDAALPTHMQLLEGEGRAPESPTNT